MATGHHGRNARYQARSASRRECNAADATAYYMGLVEELLDDCEDQYIVPEKASLLGRLYLQCVAELHEQPIMLWISPRDVLVVDEWLAGRLDGTESVGSFDGYEVVFIRNWPVPGLDNAPKNAQAPTVTLAITHHPNYQEPQFVAEFPEAI